MTEIKMRLAQKKYFMLHAPRQTGKTSSTPALVIDEIDALVGDTLISVLRQIRSGYPQRPGQFPSSIVLCEVRDQ